jgi:hypothetical protein
MLANHIDVIYALPMRSCAKMGCREPAAATMGIRYQARELLVADLLPQHDPNLMDLCSDHVARMRPPFGWTLVDIRPAPTATESLTLGLGASSA